MTQTTDRLLLDLAYTFARQVEFFADLFERHFRTADAEEIFDDIPLALGQRFQGTIHLGRERLVNQPSVGIGRMFMIMEILNTCMNKGYRFWTIKDNYRLGDDIQSKVLAFASLVICTF